ncbi:hypothetical protein HW555_013500 [Spodoptera exigua]|uniref:Uncharacterized protein n=1 Tax=Spodoptera exigua TaxID=7107 RepID=A0A835G4M9_SPOEX|nr:hypothetical protein HW555_013500 [Spodoptera exigua]
MLSMLVVAALTRISCIYTMPSYENQYYSHILKVFSEDDMTPDFRELLVIQDTQESDNKKQSPASNEKNETIPLEANITTTENPANVSLPAQPQTSEESQQQDKKIPNSNDEVDVVDREDHVTQYLSDLLVNTDNEITSLQGTEVEDDREVLLPCFAPKCHSVMIAPEKPFEVEDAW